MRNKLLKNLKERMDEEISVRNPLMYLKDIEPSALINIAVPVIYLYSREPRNASQQKSILFTEVICAIGHAIRSRHKMKRDSALAAKTGAFVLYSFEALRLISTKLVAGNTHGTYTILIENDDAIQKLWETIPLEKVEKLPSTTPYSPWTSGLHETGVPLVKTNSREVIGSLNPYDHPIVFATVNRAQAQGWCVNADLFPLVGWALRNKADAFANIWEIQNDEAKRSKLREAQAVASVAKRFVGGVFYH